MLVSSTGNLITVRFKSDAYVSGRGFNASWAEVQGGEWKLLRACPYDMHTVKGMYAKGQRFRYAYTYTQKNLPEVWLSN